MEKPDSDKYNNGFQGDSAKSLFPGMNKALADAAKVTNDFFPDIWHTSGEKWVNDQFFKDHLSQFVNDPDFMTILDEKKNELLNDLREFEEKCLNKNFRIASDEISNRLALINFNIDLLSESWFNVLWYKKSLSLLIEKGLMFVLDNFKEEGFPKDVVCNMLPVLQDLYSEINFAEKIWYNVQVIKQTFFSYVKINLKNDLVFLKEQWENHNNDYIVLMRINLVYAKIIGVDVSDLEEEFDAFEVSYS